MGGKTSLILNSGSRWHRWEPHVHAPGTVLNDQFKGADAWERYLTALESASPAIRAIGITDYYSTTSYERVVSEKAGGRLRDCDLIFPNIEMRLGIGTVKGKWVNLHLLVSPEDPDHLVELERILPRLTFNAHDDTYACNRADLTRLGKRANSKLTDPIAALEQGSQQFKVSFEQLKKIYKESKWAQENILVAVAGSETDGTSGVRDSADATLRQEIEKFAHVIFASSPAQREFWLGQGALDEETVCERYGGLKPCLHGSDAHQQSTVGAPAGNRYSWVKGAVAFDTLRQASIDPVGRAYVGEDFPMSATPSQVIEAVEIVDAPWAKTPRLELNPGLVAIIGARGSGKTALADILALGCDATSDRLSPASFLTRAKNLFGDAYVSLKWQAGDPTRRFLDGQDEDTSAEFPRARYLSQQFVEELCSAYGMTDALMREIERVVFEAHPISDRDGAIDFSELLELRASRFRIAREREEAALADISERVGMELEKDKQISGLAKQVAEKEKLIAGYVTDRGKLIVKGSEKRIERLGHLASAADAVRNNIRFFVSKEQALLSLKDEVANFRGHQAPEALKRSQERYKVAHLNSKQWEPFLLDYRGDVDGTLSGQLGDAKKRAVEWKGQPASVTDPNVALIGEDAELKNTTLNLLEAEIGRLEKLIGADRVTADKFSALTKRINEETTSLNNLKERLTDCQGARERVRQLVQDREAAYVRVFEAVVAEEAILSELYSPLMERLKASSGTLKKLSFSVTREADVKEWADAGEDLLDLRRQGSFKGRGTLRQYADADLKTAWETGDPSAVGKAMADFRKKYEKTILEGTTTKADPAVFREWAKHYAKWLYGTEHIKIRYGIEYDNLDIRKLSPGGRGIVLLLLYLALDDADDRPLIIDQPEENLDPKSIFDELVGLFIQAKSKRQVIMVTHNANLVVNTDADQVIVANVGPHVTGALPAISYTSGGLENAEIRKAVCDILEGGERAFQERARRLRVSLAR